MIIKSGLLLRSELGRPLDPIPKFTKSNRSNDKKMKLWFLKQHNDELDYIGTPYPFLYSKFEDRKKMTETDCGDACMLLFGSACGPLEWHRITKNAEKERARDIKTIRDIEQSISHFEIGHDTHTQLLRMIKIMYGTLLMEDELDRRWREKDKTRFKPLHNIDAFKNSSVHIPAVTDGDFKLDVGFQVWKVCDAATQEIAA